MAPVKLKELKEQLKDLLEKGFIRPISLPWEASLEEDHADHLRVVLAVLRHQKLYAKFSKCEFWLTSVTFLGYIVRANGIQVDTQKIKAVKNWPRPMTPIEICSFLGLTGYYRRFIEKFARILASLTRLTQKGAKFQWTDAYE
ncbi:uncharacterized mitochondrial protein AtMg00860-like [Solanum dulcamara]|uniref:uncharacterized mitochondrial protein AtMg00860-like n=1 Tax=Solanum dulcamara TaxID=45834 RepID=UPI0024862434|nr:uncharacterized mitochondrial protein AtMg00860-like [Solanum dulcamara]